MASYFLGASEGKSSKTGNPFWLVTLLTVNRFGRWSGVDSFITQKVYGRIMKQQYSAGSPVLPVFTADGALKDLKPDNSVAPLELIPDDDD